MRNDVRMAMRTNLLLPEALVAEVDRVAGPRGRSRYVAEAVERRLRADRLRDAARAVAGSWRDHPEFPTSAAVVEWVRRGREERTGSDTDLP
jgi:Arc/MetJ family transcription regulator